MVLLDELLGINNLTNKKNNETEDILYDRSSQAQLGAGDSVPESTSQNKRGGRDSKAQKDARGIREVVAKSGIDWQVGE